METLPIPPFALSGPELRERFRALQQRLVPLWSLIREMTEDAQTIVVLPSLTVDFPLHGALLQAYEERFLFLLFLLRQPRAKLIFLTSQAVDHTIVEYYLDLLPGVIASQARERLHFLSPLDGCAEPLSVKILKRPMLQERIRRLIPSRKHAHMVPFITTSRERELALRLDVPIFGADPEHQRFGSKSGSRELFVECGVSCPIGRENLSTRADVVAALCDIKREHPGMQRAMVKHDDGVSGKGNAEVDMRKVDPTDPATAERAIDAMTLEDYDSNVDEFLAKMKAGGIVEERVQGEDIRSPSAQLRITPLGEVQLISTHDQLLGGPSGQKYTGCTFPAAEGYAPTIARESLKVGERLAKAGELGRFAIDFVVVRQGSEWSTYAIEINLRKGGTTHPFLTLQFLTDGHYDGERARFVSASGHEKCFVASDSVESPKYRALTVDDVFDIATRHKLHYDQARQTGVVFHMLSALGEYGRLGLTAVGGTHDEAQDWYDRTVAVLDQEAEAALTPLPVR